MKNIIIIMGSHRPNQNTAWLGQQLKKAYELEQVTVEWVDINQQAITHCKDCNYCRTHYGQCVIQDDMTDLYDKLKKADELIILTPVYFCGLSSKLKVLIDRLQMCFMCDFAHHKSFRDKAKGHGYCISIGGAKNYPDQFTGIEASIRFAFRYLGYDLDEHIQLSDTDHVLLKERKEQVDTIINRIVRRES